MATISSLSDRVRFELGDAGKSFVTQFVADGSTNRFRLHYAPVDGPSLVVYQNGLDISANCSVEESTGVLITEDVPADGAEITVSGTYYRYFTPTEMAHLVETAVTEHSANHTDSLGRKISIENLPLIEEHPVTIYATVLALHALATDASFDIGISAPDGVNIPRSERYRQLLDMIASRQAQYRDLCVTLGVGLYKIDVFTFRRISKMTNRYVPVYKPQEVDDRSWAQRVNDEIPAYGDKDPVWPTEAEELTAYQGRSFATSLDYTGNWAGKTFVAQILTQRGSVQATHNFALEVETTGTSDVIAAARTLNSTTITLTTAAAHGYAVNDVVVVMGVDETVDGSYTVATVGTTTTFTVVGSDTTALALTDLTGYAELSEDKAYTFTLSLTKDQTLLLANRTYWSLAVVDYFTDEQVEIKGGSFFTVRKSESKL